MTDLQISDISDSFYQRLEHYAQRRQCTLRQMVIDVLERELAASEDKLTRSEFAERLKQHPRTELGVSAASLLKEERAGGNGIDGTEQS